MKSIVQFVREEFDKLLLLFLVVFFVGHETFLILHFPNLDQATLQWVEKSADLSLGALIGAITAQMATQRMQHQKEAQKPEEPPKVEAAKA